MKTSMETNMDSKGALTIIASMGLHLGVSFKMKSILDGLIEKVECHLTGWKQLYLSKGWCVALIKGTLSNLLVFIPYPCGINLPFFISFKGTSHGRITGLGNEF